MGEIEYIDSDNEVVVSDLEPELEKSPSEENIFDFSIYDSGETKEGVWINIKIKWFSKLQTLLSSKVVSSIIWTLPFVCKNLWTSSTEPGMFLYGGHVFCQQETGTSQKTQEKLDLSQQGFQIGLQEFCQV